MSWTDERVDLLRKLWIGELGKRLGYDGAQRIKADPFFESIEWGTIEKGGHSTSMAPKSIELLAF